MTTSTAMQRKLTVNELDAVSGGGGHRNQDRLGQFAIQTMMSDYNQARALASSILKKQEDTTSSVIQKIG